MRIIMIGTKLNNVMKSAKTLWKKGDVISEFIYFTIAEHNVVNAKIFTNCQILETTITKCSFDDDCIGKEFVLPIIERKFNSHENVIIEIKDRENNTETFNITVIFSDGTQTTFINHKQDIERCLYVEKNAKNFRENLNKLDWERGEKVRFLC